MPRKLAVRGFRRFFADKSAVRAAPVAAFGHQADHDLNTRSISLVTVCFFLVELPILAAHLQSFKTPVIQLRPPLKWRSSWRVHRRIFPRSKRVMGRDIIASGRIGSRRRVRCSTPEPSRKFIVACMRAENKRENIDWRAAGDGLSVRTPLGLMNAAGDRSMLITWWCAGLVIGSSSPACLG